jgi:ABC-type branched-subunit amino acid transport system ATPase component
MSLLTLDNILSGYGKKEVIRNISFQIDKAQIVTLIGSNGAGKSTILKTIYALNSIWNEGKIYFNDSDISNSKPEYLLKQGMVYIGQKSNTFDSLTILENLKTAGYIYEKKILEQKLKDIFEMFPKLASMQKLKPSELSGGQKQLVALAMGLIHEPKLILFDEPSAGLDVKNMNEVFGIIERLKVEKSISFLIVEHRVKEIEKISDRFIGLKLGEKIYDGVGVDEDILREIFL